MHVQGIVFHIQGGSTRASLFVCVWVGGWVACVRACVRACVCVREREGGGSARARDRSRKFVLTVFLFFAL